MTPARKRAAKKPGGRRRKNTPTRLQEILTAAETGMTMEGCARAGGIAPSTLYDWLNKDAEFSERFTRARSAAERRLVELVEAQDPKFLLERSYQYVKRLEVSGPDGDPIVVRSWRPGDKPRKRARRGG